jgi:hypothetical protein
MHLYTGKRENSIVAAYLPSGQGQKRRMAVE